MRVAVFSTKPYDRHYLVAGNASFGHDLVFFEAHLSEVTAKLAHGFEGICVFVNDQVNVKVIEQLASCGLRTIALRCAGFNNVDLAAARRFGVNVARVPAYSPHAVAEHTVGLMLSLNRKIHRAYARVRDGNFSIEGLLGFDMRGRTVGIVGTGAIGSIVAQILAGFGCIILATDPRPNRACEAFGAMYVSLSDLIRDSDIISLHCPLTPETKHLIGAREVAAMKTGVMLVNTSRGAVIDAKAVLGGLKAKKIGYLGLDVYEEEADVFFEDLSNQIIDDDVLARLLTFPNVLVTSHQAFFTHEAMTQISRTTLHNLRILDEGVPVAIRALVEQELPDGTLLVRRLRSQYQRNSHGVHLES